MRYNIYKSQMYIDTVTIKLRDNLLRSTLDTISNTFLVFNYDNRSKVSKCIMLLSLLGWFSIF